MKALVRNNHHIELKERKMPKIIHSRDAIVKVKMSSICTSDLHIKHGHIPMAKQGVTLGHEFVGEIVELGAGVKNLNIGDYLIDDSTKNGAAEFTGEHIQIHSDKFPDWNSVIDYISKKENLNL